MRARMLGRTGSGVIGGYVLYRFCAFLSELNDVLVALLSCCCVRIWFFACSR